jgi:hypothetical protein
MKRQQCFCWYRSCRAYASTAAVTETVTDTELELHCDYTPLAAGCLDADVVEIEVDVGAAAIGSGSVDGSAG